MEPEMIIKILQRKTTIPGDGFAYDQISSAIDEAIVEVGKKIPRKPIRESWSPNKCPTCGEELGGDCNDGYYDNPYFERCPTCGQKLDYDL